MHFAKYALLNGFWKVANETIRTLIHIFSSRDNLIELKPNLFVFVDIYILSK